VTGAQTAGPLVLGIDVGTSGCKAVMLDRAGRVVATSTHGYATRRSPDGEVTQDADDWIAAARSAIRDCVAAADGPSVAAIGVTGPAHYAVLADAEGRPLSRVLLSSDGRPAGVASELRSWLGERFFEVTHERLTAAWTFPQLVWLYRQQPDLWKQLRHVLVVKDYLRFVLTGQVATDPSDAAGTGLYDQNIGAWAQDLLREAHLLPAQLPPIQPSLSVGAGLSPEWASRLGLRAGVPVAIGATDTAAELVSVGAVNDTDSIVKIASTGTVVAVADRPRAHPLLLAYPHAVTGRWYTAAATSTAATAYSWLANTLLADRPNAGVDYRGMDRLAARVPPGSGGLLFLPFLEGERTPWWDPDLRGAFLGVSSSHTRANFCRAVLEGVGLALRSCRDVMRDAGLAVDRPIYSGGGVRSPLWRTILASVLGTDGSVVEPQGPAIGAALIASAAARVGPCAGGRPVPRLRRRAVGPRGEWLEPYDTLYGVYRQAVAGVEQPSHELTAFVRRSPS
jgi:xylulokinase